MKNSKRRKSHKKATGRSGQRRKSLYIGVIVAVLCIGSGIFCAVMLKKVHNEDNEKIELSTGASELPSEAGLIEITNTEKVTETEIAEMTASEPEIHPERETARKVDSAADQTVSDQAEADNEVPDEIAAVDNSAAASDDPVVLNVPGETVSYDLLPGTILTAEQLDLEELTQYFTAVAIEEGDAVYNRINGRSWQENDHIFLSDLRYLKVLHYNFSGQIQVGEMIVNKSIADDVIGIFEELFACGYQIQSMYLIDNYWTGDPDDSDTASIDENNTSAFCYRPITNGTKLSNHAYGRAIDLNPQQNPYVSYSSGAPKWYHENASDYIARETGLPHVITHEDAAFLIFQKHGFTWGGDWNNPKDYQHFEKK